MYIFGRQGVGKWHTWYRRDNKENDILTVTHMACEEISVDMLSRRLSQIPAAGHPTRRLSGTPQKLGGLQKPGTCEKLLQP